MKSKNDLVRQRGRLRKRITEIQESYTKFKTTYAVGVSLEMEITNLGYKCAIANTQNHLAEVNREIKSAS